MEPSTFVKWLRTAMHGAESVDCKHIIRFSSRRDYFACIRELHRSTKDTDLLNGIQPLAVINAISCTLNTTAVLSPVPFAHSIEVDAKMNVHSIKVVNAVQPLNSATPSDTASVPWGIKHIRAPQAWAKSKGDRIRIGVIDTGADYNHPDLRHCLSYGVNLVNRHLLPNDDNGHGTHIAGTIAAASIRPRGIIGVAPQAIIHPVKAFDHQGSAFVSDIIGGIDWCVRNQIHIINMSFGMKTYSKALELAVRHAFRSGVIVVASSGNEGKQKRIDYPARLPQVIAVGASTRRGKIASFSNISKMIDIYAPGEKIYSTWLKGKYHELSGTSMATSHVSGVIALMLSRRPGLNPTQIKTIVKRHARLLLKPGMGIREIHALRAVSAVIKPILVSNKS
ncbi:S8 family peptidase [Paenibacillus agricola]|uniref:S8 family peptidase n=1 Tax=Paenibacillus agricola TaxID=2716264 RepID=A0ABX0J6K5_9BACL|nr:S8 family peptidase [Paenibacillus agricola]NHN31979.1 S8 family peptidase [Paenibacillus agricola]